MVAKPRTKKPRVEPLTQEEVWEIFDEQARHWLGVSGEEFIRAWDAGEYPNPDRPEIMNVAMLMPRAR